MGLSLALVILGVHLGRGLCFLCIFGELLNLLQLSNGTGELEHGWEDGKEGLQRRLARAMERTLLLGEKGGNFALKGGNQKILVQETDSFAPDVW